MAINPKTTGIHHLALRCTDFNGTKKFLPGRAWLYAGP